jgi:hypothetical protein
MAFLIESWHVAINLFSVMPMVHITFWRYPKATVGMSLLILT